MQSAIQTARLVVTLPFRLFLLHRRFLAGKIRPSAFGKRYLGTCDDVRQVTMSAVYLSGCERKREPKSANVLIGGGPCLTKPPDADGSEAEKEETKGTLEARESF